jgi:hypothetical protein
LDCEPDFSHADYGGFLVFVPGHFEAVFYLLPHFAVLSVEAV